MLRVIIINPFLTPDAKSVGCYKFDVPVCVCLSLSVAS